jgi:hypothetical protein
MKAQDIYKPDLKDFKNRTIVTKRALDDWIAQLYGFTCDTIPKVRPTHMP